MPTVAFLLLAAWFSAGADPALPDGEGKAIIERACTSCHGADFIVGRKRTPDLWDEVVLKMADRGAPLEEADKPVLLAYLNKYFGSDTPPPPPEPAKPLPPL